MKHRDPLDLGIDPLSGPGSGAGLRSAPLVEGQVRLCLAVLQDAITTFRKYAGAVRGRERRLFEEAQEWLLEPNTGAPLSLEYVGEALGVDPGDIRAAIERWRREHLAAAAQHAAMDSAGSAQPTERRAEVCEAKSRVGANGRHG